MNFLRDRHDGNKIKLWMHKNGDSPLLSLLSLGAFIFAMWAMHRAWVITH